MQLRRRGKQSPAAQTVTRLALLSLRKVPRRVLKVAKGSTAMNGLIGLPSKWTTPFTQNSVRVNGVVWPANSGQRHRPLRLDPLADGSARVLITPPLCDKPSRRCRAGYGAVVAGSLSDSFGRGLVRPPTLSRVGNKLAGLRRPIDSASSHSRHSPFEFDESERVSYLIRCQLS